MAEKPTKTESAHNDALDDTSFPKRLIEELHDEPDATLAGLTATVFPFLVGIATLLGGLSALVVSGLTRFAGVGAIIAAVEAVASRRERRAKETHRILHDAEPEFFRDIDRYLVELHKEVVS